MATPVLEIDGDRLVARMLFDVERRTLHPRPAYAVIGLQMLHAEKQLFDSQGSFAGHPWRPDQPATLEAKAREGLDPRVMHATRRLRRSLVQRGNPEQIRRSTDRGIVFGTRVPYAKYHKDDRDPVQFGVLQRRQFSRTLQDWVVRGAL